MNTLVEKFPASKLAEMAGMIINGVKSGRRLHGGAFDLGNVWERRSMVLNDHDSTQVRQLSNERNTDFVFMLVYQPDSVDQNKLLYEVARYNFTSYLARDFNITIEEGDGINRMQLSGFRSYDEALQYAHQLLRQPGVVSRMGKARPVIISVENLPLLGTQYSYEEYAAFYAKHFAPLKVSTFHLLTEPVDVTPAPQSGEPERITESDIDDFLNNTVVSPEDIEPERQGTTVLPLEPVDVEPTPAPKPVKPVQAPAPEPAHRVPPVQEKPAIHPTLSNGADIIFDDDTPMPPAQPAQRSTVPADNRTATKKVDNRTDPSKNTKGNGKAAKTATKPTLQKPADKKTEAQKPEPKRQTFDLEDEYYELDGF
jgi:hypothetical protein